MIDICNEGADKIGFIALREMRITGAFLQLRILNTRSGTVKYYIFDNNRPLRMNDFNF